MRQTLAAGALTAALTLMACAEAPDRPDAALRRYLEAVRRDDPAAAWACLSTRARDEQPLGPFTLRWRARRPELLGQATELERALASPEGVAELARVRVGAGEATALLAADGADGGRYRLAEPPTSLLVAATPRDALAALIAALDRGDLAALGRLLGDAQRESLGARLRERAAQLRSRIDLPVRVQGNQARIEYGAGQFVLLERGAAGWRVIDYSFE